MESRERVVTDTPQMKRKKQGCGGLGEGGA